MSVEKMDIKAIRPRPHVVNSAPYAGDPRTAPVPFDELSSVLVFYFETDREGTECKTYLRRKNV